jgi:hypothetical protein
MPPGSHSGIAAVADLVRASHHLEAAGAPELAAQVRQQARLVLEREAQRLAQEQALLQELAQSLPQTQYMIQAVIAKACVTSNELEDAVQRTAGDAVVRHEQGDPVWVLDSDRADDLLQMLGDDDDVQLQILSRPQIVTMDGRPASFIVGNPIALVADVDEPAAASPPLAPQQPINGLTVGERRSDPEFTGVSVTVTPTSAGENKMRIEAVLENSTIQATVPITDAQTGSTYQSPVQDITRGQSIVEVQPGGTFVMAIPCQAPDCAAAESGTSQLLLIVTTRLVTR